MSGEGDRVDRWPKCDKCGELRFPNDRHSRVCKGAAPLKRQERLEALIQQLRSAFEPGAWPTIDIDTRYNYGRVGRMTIPGRYDERPTVLQGVTITVHLGNDRPKCPRCDMIQDDGLVSDHSGQRFPGRYPDGFCQGCGERLSA